MLPTNFSSARNNLPTTPARHPLPKSMLFFSMPFLRLIRSNHKTRLLINKNKQHKKQPYSHHTNAQNTARHNIRGNSTTA